MADLLKKKNTYYPPLPTESRNNNNFLKINIQNFNSYLSYGLLSQISILYKVRLKTQITSAMQVWVKVERDEERNAPTVECPVNHISPAYNLKIKTIIRIYSEAQIPYSTTTSQYQKTNRKFSTTLVITSLS